jgi:uncharacterized SAM-binding protein YcdF (DUF218 family)
MKRDNFTQLPNSAELQSILAKEAKRNLPEGKDIVHYFKFSPLIKMVEHFGLDAKLLSGDQNLGDVVDPTFLERAKIFTEKIKEILLGRRLSAEDLEMCNEVYDYLAEQDLVREADLIFVFGAKTPLRIEKAIELYQDGLSKKLVLSGRSPHYANNQILSEAETYTEIAKKQGVSDQAIILEKESITIPDNVRSSLNLLDAKGIVYHSIILVNSPYTQRRGWAHFKKYLPDNITLIRINSETGEDYKRDSWYKNAKGIDAILGEYFKAKVAVSLNTA